MASTPPTKKARDSNLDALKSAAEQWFEIEEKRLDNESKFLRSVLSGRGITESITKNLDKVAAVVVEDINSFINFKG